METCAIVQARMGSTRLPGKVMMKLDNSNTILYYVLSQLRHSKFLDKIIVATTILSEDDQIETFSKNLGVDCFRGNPKDLVDRYYNCALKFSSSPIVRITADNPLIDPSLVDEALEQFFNNSFDVVSNCMVRTYPAGTEVEIFTLKALEIVWKNTHLSFDREHVTPYFYKNANIFKIFNISHQKNISHLRWTVDTIDDFSLVKLIISKISKRPILMNDILDLFSQEPDLINMNKHLASIQYDKESYKTP